MKKLEKLSSFLKSVWEKALDNPYEGAKMEEHDREDRYKGHKITLQDGKAFVGTYDYWRTHPDGKRAGIFTENAV